MKLRDVLNIITRTAEEYELSRPLIVGGVPRDRMRGEAKEIKDIDLTSEKGDSVKLAFVLSKKLPYTYFQLYDDGHVTIKIGQLQIDFSNHFIIPQIDAELDRLGIAKNELTKEMYSRDFTINTLLQDLYFEKVYDITGQGVKDIKSGIIRCPINPDLTISNDPKRILRALRFSLKFNYIIDNNVVDAIVKYRYLLKNISPEYLKNKINELIEIDETKAIKMIVNLGLLEVLPMTKNISDALIKNKLLYYALGEKNDPIISC
jgi:tRNA nucleotidyltransferase/poly(A) polymerase